jgi:hypothetical protein
MLTDRAQPPARLLVSSTIVTIALALTGCGHPDRANIELRKQKQALESKLEMLQRERAADAATIRSLESRATTVPVLPNERLAKLFTVHGLSLGRLTAAADLDPQKPGDEGLKVYVVPTDDDGQPLKAAGSFIVEAFDLAKSGDNRVGRWHFSADQARQNWYSLLTLYTYILPCPWQTGAPQHSQLTLRVSFTDELTHRTFTAQKILKLPPGPAR